MVATGSPRAMLPVQRVRLWAMPGWPAKSPMASQVPFGKLSIGGEASRGEMVESHGVLQVPDGILDPGVAVVVGLQFQGVALVAGDEGVIAVAGKESQLGAGRGLDPADDEPQRHGVGLTPNGMYSGSATSATPSIQ